MLGKCYKIARQNEAKAVRSAQQGQRKNFDCSVEIATLISSFWLLARCASTATVTNLRLIGGNA